MKKYIVRLSEAERKTCQEVIGKLKGSSQKARRARILLQVDAGWARLVRPPGRGGIRLLGAHRRERAQTLRAGRL